MVGGWSDDVEQSSGSMDRVFVLLLGYFLSRPRLALRAMQAGCQYSDNIFKTEIFA